MNCLQACYWFHKLSSLYVFTIYWFQIKISLQKFPFKTKKKSHKLHKLFVVFFYLENNKKDFMVFFEKFKNFLEVLQMLVLFYSFLHRSMFKCFYLNFICVSSWISFARYSHAPAIGIPFFHPFRVLSCFVWLHMSVFGVHRWVHMP